jgi:hypothetical protein
MLIKIGYSGSRRGMTTLQMRAVYRYLGHVLGVNDWDEPVIEGHHGDCIGGDAQFHVIATVLGCRTVSHPPANSSKRAWCRADEIRAPKDYLPRDWDIANETGELLAAPARITPDWHSGTWTTIGYAVQLGRPARVFAPDGQCYDGRGFFGAPLPAVPGNVVGT